MKEKVKQTMGRLRKSVRAAGVGLSTLAASFFMSAPAYAAGVEDSQIDRYLFQHACRVRRHQCRK